jgi:signal transduction histidine kinase
MAGRVWSEAHPIWVTKVALEANFVRAQAASRIGLRSALGIPIFVGKEVQAVLTFFSLRSQEPDDALLQQMSTLGTQIGQFIRRRRIEEDLRLAHAELEVRIARRTQQLSQANESLQLEISEREQAEESLRQLSARLLRIQDEERQRLARELHDSTAQSLAALAMNLAVVRGGRAKLPKRSQQALDESEVLAELCAREIRSLSYVLHPPLLKEIGLPAAVRWCAEGFAKRSGIAVDVDSPNDFGRLPVDVETALFRIVQECLTNVQRHSGSPTARIELSRRDHSVGLKVKDQGRGIPPGILRHRSSLGVGLLGMRERVRQLGGRLSIDSTGTGATVQVEIDLPPEAA